MELLGIDVTFLFLYETSPCDTRFFLLKHGVNFAEAGHMLRLLLFYNNRSIVRSSRNPTLVMLISVMLINKKRVQHFTINRFSEKLRPMGTLSSLLHLL